MTDTEAKDFIIGEVIEQAAREGASLSPLERGVMYLSGGDPEYDRLAPEFEGQLHATISAAKISLLLHHAYDRLKKEDRDKSAKWEGAVRRLEDGDHYLLKFWVLLPPYEIGRRDSGAWLMMSRLPVGIRKAWLRLTGTDGGDPRGRRGVPSSRRRT